MRPSFITLLILGMLLVPSPGLALTLALKGGANQANLDQDGPSDAAFESTMHYGGGVLFCGAINGALAIDVEFLYVQKGAKYAFEADHADGGDYTYESTSQLNYAVISPMLRITPFESRIAPFFTVGGEFGHYLSGEATWERNAGGEHESGTVDLKDAVRDMDYSVCFGGGLTFASEAATFFIESRYVHGLANINQGDEEDGEYEQFTRGIYAFAGVRFD